MLRRFSSAALTLVLVLTLGSASYTATDDDSIEKTNTFIQSSIKNEVKEDLKEKDLIEIITPEDQSITSLKTVLLSGKTNSDIDTKDITVVVEIYSNRDSAIDYFENDIYIKNGLVNEDLLNEMLSLKSEEDFIKINTQKIKIDILGLFNEEIELLTGKNKLKLIATKEDEVLFTKDINITVTDENTALEYLKDINNTNILDNFKSHMEENKDNKDSKENQEENSF